MISPGKKGPLTALPYSRVLTPFYLRLSRFKLMIFAENILAEIVEGSGRVVGFEKRLTI